ncbi:Delta3,5-Delta2,4-dienoyl-CoA isomerase [Marchantia polymorpha subsp. ruderalis]|nr:hypothetical protein MARPO_0065s0040 [Marchantia polymorpha]BBM99729.1 hypothetical protein Mp_1g23380 [Marchantia polymorpha subsp. ruderalis]|eukprot:PTQ36227.1 hypothetical protein MARPO_0065s0040 [Marchantia polymorpha]
MKSDGMHFESVAVEGPDFAGVARLVLNRPKQSNALNAAMFREIPAAVASLDADPNVRVIIVAGSGKHFCAGIDLQFLSTDSVQSSSAGGGAGRLGLEREAFRRHVKWLQDAFTSFEHCRKPVIAAIHGACIGAGIDMITACDLRYCTDDAKFSVKEVDLAITADLGTLQRLPHVVGYSATMELALTARAFDGKEARELKLVHGVLPSKDLLDERVYAVAAEIAGKSPLAIMGTKAVLLKSRNSSVADGLDYVATWNAALLHKEDILEAMMSRMEHRNPLFAKL